MMRQLCGTFYALSMRLYQQLRSGGGRAVLISSARPEEGKTFVARNVASFLAELSPDMVLLVDANLERPSLHAAYGVSNDIGFSDALAHGRFGEVPVHPTLQPNLKLMTVGQTLKPGVLFRPQHFADFLAHFGRNFGVILFDGGLLGASGCLPHQCDGTIMVVDAGNTRREVIQGVMAQAKIERSRYLGAILNKRMQYIPRAFYRYF